MRRIERLINLIIALLETPRPMTAEDIKRKVAGYDQPDHENFRRSFERDKKDLRDMGIPIETVKLGVFEDEGDAYIIPKDKYYLPELDLEADELAALRIAAESVLGAGDAAGSAFRKLSIDAASDALSAPRVVWGADVATEQPLLAPLFAAVTDRQAVTFTYERSDGDRSKRKLEPYTLLHRRGHWYVVGRDRDRDAIRSFKVSRIVGKVENLEGPYEVPEEFEASQVTGLEPWEIGGETDTQAIVRFAPAMRWWAEQNLSGMPSEAAGDSLHVRIPYANLPALVSWVVGFGTDAEVVEPPEARVAVLEHVRAWSRS